MHMTRTDAITGYGSDDKRYKWHMHMTRADGSGVVAVMTKESSGTCINI